MVYKKCNAEGNYLLVPQRTERKRDFGRFYWVISRTQRIWQSCKSLWHKGIYGTKKASRVTGWNSFGSGEWNRTTDLQVMSLISCHCSTPQHCYIIYRTFRGLSNVFDIFLLLSHDFFYKTAVKSLFFMFFTTKLQVCYMIRSFFTTLLTRSLRGGSGYTDDCRLCSRVGRAGQSSSNGFPGRADIRHCRLSSGLREE